MNLLNKCTNNEIELIKQAGVKIENKEYTAEELKRIESNITEFIMNHSTKNGDITRLQNEYQGIYNIIEIN
ncbi:MAG: hypothetical protein IJ223_07475 [Clostridia bacterium]|nr:hypothetical protein [Clostridia bacterium]